jgi:hypothetical protein
VDESYLLRWAEAGLEEACEKFSAALKAGDAQREYTAAAEALAWIVALDDEHAERMGPKKATYQKARDADPDGVVIRGLRWARNRSLHQLARLLTRGPEAPFLPWEPAGRLHWAPRALVRGRAQPEEHRDKPQTKALERAYDSAVRDRPAAVVLDRARRWLVEKAPRLVP